MSQIITFENTLLANTGKRGDLKPMDSSGYYRMNAGAFNIPNRHKITYILNDYLRECMREGSDLDRRVKEGQMYCELNHPPQYYNIVLPNGEIARKPIIDLFEWINRLRTIDMDNVCAHIRKIHWTKTGGDRDPVHLDAEIIPFGPKKIWVEESLPNPDINSALSIRTVTKPQQMGHTTREVDYWSTFDWVVEQGILRACKHLSAGLESLLDSYVENDHSNDKVFATTMEELFFVCEKKMSMPEVQQRYAGTESFERVSHMLAELKKNLPRKEQKIQLVTSSALSVFR